MTTFLRFQIGTYPFVLPTTRLIAIEAAANESAIRRSWRGRTLPLLDLTRYVGATEGPVRHDLVLEEDEPGIASCVVRVDQVDGLIELTSNRMESLPSGDANIRALIEGVCIDGQGKQSAMLFRLRVPREAFDMEAYGNE